MNYIDKDLMEKMCHPLAVAIFEKHEEPIAQFNEHELALLDSALNNPRQTFGGKELYPTLSEKAAILYYSLIKNHPFRNGNKRISTASLLVFLFINDYWLSGPHKEIEDYLFNLATRVAQLDDVNRDATLKEVSTWLEDHIQLL